MLNFEELYAVTVKKAKCIKFEHSLMKTMRESAFRELNHQKKSLMKSDAVIVCVDDMFLFCQQSEFTEKSKSKTVLNIIIQSQLNNLSLKAEIF